MRRGIYTLYQYKIHYKLELNEYSLIALAITRQMCELKFGLVLLICIVPIRLNMIRAL